MYFSFIYNIVILCFTGDTSNSDLLPSSPSERKTGSLVLTEEECHLLNQEGIELPTDMPLTKVILTKFN